MEQTSKNDFLSSDPYKTGISNQTREQFYFYCDLVTSVLHTLCQKVQKISTAHFIKNPIKNHYAVPMLYQRGNKNLKVFIKYMFPLNYKNITFLYTYCQKISQTYKTLTTIYSIHQGLISSKEPQV